MSPESITVATIAPLSCADSWWPLIGCSDRTIRVLDDTRVVQVSRAWLSGVAVGNVTETQPFGEMLHGISSVACHGR
jgi:hypothetical protein